MKLKHKMKCRRLASLLVTGALLIGCVGFSAAAETNDLTPAEQYKAYVDSLDWPGYDNHVDMVNAAQIPTYILNQMSTDDLVEAYFAYPLRVDLIAWDTYATGFKAVKSQFNGLDELVSREDGAQKLVEKMQEIPVVTNARSVDHEQYIRPLYLDVLLAQPEFMNQLSEPEAEEALAVVDNIVEQRDPEIYGNSTYRFYKAANEQVETYSYSLQVRTPGGKYASANVFEYGDTDIDIGGTNREYIGNYPNATFLDNSTRMYNCHSYAWYRQTSNNNYWIGNPEPYLTDGTCSNTGVFKTGTRVMYYNVDQSGWNTSAYFHSAIVASGNTYPTVTSKWGQGPLMRHSLSYCPYYAPAKTISYWNY